MTDPYIQINGTKIEVFDNDLSAVKTIKQLAENTPISGWILPSPYSAFVFASPTQINASYDVTYIQKSDKIRYKQGGAYKYGYIISITDQTTSWALGVAGDTVTNAAITDFAYSHIENPLGFPDWFNYVPFVSGNVGSIGTYAQDHVTGKFKISGNACTVNASLRMTNVGSWSGNVQFLLPVVCISGYDDFMVNGIIVATSTSAIKAFALGTNNTNKLVFAANIYAAYYGTFTANDVFLVQGTFQI